MSYVLLDPHLPVNINKALKNLEANIDISLANYPQTITTENTAGLVDHDKLNLEILFVLDMSDDSEDILRRSLTFAKNYIVKVFF